MKRQTTRTSTTLWMLISLVGTFWAINAHAAHERVYGDVIAIDIDITERGPDTIPLRRLLRDHFNRDLNHYALRAVIVNSQDYGGRGYVRLRSGSYRTPAIYLDGYRTQIDSPGPSRHDWKLYVGTGTYIEGLTIVMEPLHAFADRHQNYVVDPYYRDDFYWLWFDNGYVYRDFRSLGFHGSFYPDRRGVYRNTYRRHRHAGPYYGHGPRHRDRAHHGHRDHDRGRAHAGRHRDSDGRHHDRNRHRDQDRHHDRGHNRRHDRDSRGRHRNGQVSQSRDERRQGRRDGRHGERHADAGSTGNGHRQLYGSHSRNESRQGSRHESRERSRQRSREPSRDHSRGDRPRRQNPAAGATAQRGNRDHSRNGNGRAGSRRSSEQTASAPSRGSRQSGKGNGFLKRGGLDKSAARFQRRN